MGNIVLLDELTINKIAAGEVIERPASVVKEMIENSIDAGAKNITVEIKNGGISLIKITDDGCGIAQDDMEIAFERHATSKIRKAEDLEIVKTMGFRGEALASIAAISKVEMISKKQDSDMAYKIVVEGGKVLEFTEAARPIGTTITVQNLFYNTPVRYKFLKKDYTEAGYIEDAVTRIALINRNVAIKLISNGKTVVQTNGNGDIKTVIYSIYGKDVASEIIEVDYSYEGMRVTGVIGKPVIARGNRSNQLFFLNGRYIKDKNLTAAADQAYKGMIPVGRYGFIVLNLDINPKLVDVNVHPAKLEVRFEEETKVFKAIYHAIKTNLARSELVANVEKRSPIMDNQNATKEKEVKKEFSNNNLLHEDKNESGISGLFKKIIKEPEETQEELNNNHLEEIFKFRNGLVKETGKTTEVLKENEVPYEDKEKRVKENIVENLQNNSKKEENNLEELKNSENVLLAEDEVKFSSGKFKTINDNDLYKNVALGNTLISSDTKELDINEASELVKKASQETSTAIKEDLNDLPQHTIVIEENVMKKAESDESDVINDEKPEEETIGKDNTNDSDLLEEFSKLFESKLDIDNTQSIDTSKVREAIKEENFENNPEFDKMYRKTFGVDPFSVRKEKELEEMEKEKLNASNDFSYVPENMNVFEDEKIETIPYKFLGIAFSTYIIIEIKNEMYIIDQHAAHERIMYEKIKANYYSESEKDEQFLLLPDVISLTHKEMSIARENIEMFSKAGFSFEEFGDNTIKLMSVPSMCEELNTKQLFLDILDEIDTVAVTARQEKEDKFIATVACKAAVKAKMKLDEKEVENLMSKLLELPNPFTCPHGRPTAIKMTKYDLEKKFNRR